MCLFRLLSRPAIMTISVNHEPPALVNEYYVIKVIVKNDEDKEISKVQWVIISGDSRLNTWAISLGQISLCYRLSLYGYICTVEAFCIHKHNYVKPSSLINVLFSIYCHRLAFGLKEGQDPIVEQSSMFCLITQYLIFALISGTFSL